jgi:hypothetical protein
MGGGIHLRRSGTLASVNDWSEGGRANRLPHCHFFEQFLREVRQRLIGKRGQYRGLNDIVLTYKPTHEAGHHGDLRHSTFGTNSIQLVFRWGVNLYSHDRTFTLLRSAAALWVTNVLVFALWYWRLDAGGPHQRDLRAGHPSGSFLFAQMTFREDDVPPEWKGWSPTFIDYLFLAFNTSTAFSPTDVPVLSRWAKLLTMAQASISLTVVVILAARAVNIL